MRCAPTTTQAPSLASKASCDRDGSTPFWPYVSWWVRQAMQRLVAELTRPVVLSDRALRQLARLKDAHREHLHRDGLEPTVADLAASTGLSRDQVGKLLAVERPARSLDEPLGAEEEELALGDLLDDPLAESDYEAALSRLAGRELRTLLTTLSERERAVVCQRHGLDGTELSLRDVAGDLGLSAERVRQIEDRALSKLAAAAGDVVTQG